VRENRGPEILRRLLLALVTALIVTRPLVLGEDPGLLNRLSSAWSLVLSLLWLITAVGWAVWRAWSRQTRWRGSAVEAGLLASAVFMGISACGAAHYQHPAFLIASEWLVLLCAFCLVRQLARTPAEDHGLLAALLASAVSISSFALYQYTVVFPEMRRTYGTDLHALLDAMAAENVVANPELLQRRLAEDNVFGTYSHPNSFAGYLALLLPLAIAWTFSAIGMWRVECEAPNAEHTRMSSLYSVLRPRALPILAGAGTLLIGLALWLTHSRGAILGSVFVSVVLFAVYGRRFLIAHKAALLTGIAVLAVFGAVIFRSEWMAHGLTKFGESSSKRTDYWIATWSMIRDHPWLGVGPGNFGRQYTEYMLPRAYEQIKDPHNFMLETWVTGGVFALVSLLFTLVVFFRRAWLVLGEPRGQGASGGVRQGSKQIRWEFYLGGLVGLGLGFVLRSVDQSADEILLEAFFAACRSIIWFAAFALFFRIPCSGSVRALALTAGVAALLVNLLFSGGIAMPSVAQPLWVVVALALNSFHSPPPDDARSSHWLVRLVPLPVLASICLAYFVLLCYPAISCEGALAQARQHYVEWRVITDSLRAEDPPAQQLRTASRASYYLEMTILTPVERAVAADTGNALAWLELAEWYGELWKVCPTPDQMERISRKALQCAETAESLDPDNKEPYLFKHKLHLALAEHFKQRAKEEYAYAAKAMRAAVERDPTSASLRYQLVQTLFLAQLSLDGRSQAQVALELDEQATRPERQLTPPQREQLRTWLAMR
jgi:O-antigen ligase